MKDIVDRFRQTGDDSELHEYTCSDEYRSLDYVEKNKHFITASKLKAYDECPYFAKLRYIDGVEAPQKDKDYFVVGQAVDDWITYGQEDFQDRYEKVSRRTGKSEKIELTGSQHSTVCNAVGEVQANDLIPDKMDKEIVFWLAFDKYPCKAELDHYDSKNKEIIDLKTCANILTFDPNNYWLQMSFYFVECCCLLNRTSNIIVMIDYRSICCD